MGGSLISGIGQKKAADSQADAAKAQARAMRQQADMVMKRALVNKERMRLEGKSFQGRQAASYAAAGVDLSSGSVLATLNNTFNQTEQQIEDMMTDAEYEATAIRAGAKVASKQAGQIREAGQWQMYGSLLQGGAGAAKMFM